MNKDKLEAFESKFKKLIAQFPEIKTFQYYISYDNPSEVLDQDKLEFSMFSMYPNYSVQILFGLSQWVGRIQREIEHTIALARQNAYNGKNK